MDLLICFVYADLSDWLPVILYHSMYIPLRFSISQFYGPNHRFHYHRLAFIKHIDNRDCWCESSRIADRMHYITLSKLSL